MGIPEAAALLQASSLAEGDVFVLDMGEPIKIADLVKSLFGSLEKLLQLRMSLTW